MTQHYRHIDENGTEISIQTHPAANQIRLAIIPKETYATGDRAGAVYFMPWTEQLQFSDKLQDAKDEAEKNDEAAEGLAFLQAMTGAPLEYFNRKTAMEYHERAKKYFENQEHLAAEDKE